jgi:hypothetical protein
MKAHLPNSLPENVDIDPAGTPSRPGKPGIMLNATANVSKLE